MFYSFPAAYRAAQRATGGCPIEAGARGRLVDYECSGHGRLPGDRIPRRACWARANATVKQRHTSTAIDITVTEPRGA